MVADAGGPMRPRLRGAFSPAGRQDVGRSSSFPAWPASQLVAKTMGRPANLLPTLLGGGHSHQTASQPASQPAQLSPGSLSLQATTTSQWKHADKPGCYKSLGNPSLIAHHWRWPICAAHSPVQRANSFRLTVHAAISICGLL